jgi:hypothetical protein
MLTEDGLSGQIPQASGTSETLPLMLPWRAAVGMGLFTARNEGF